MRFNGALPRFNDYELGIITTGVILSIVILLVMFPALAIGIAQLLLAGFVIIFILGIIGLWLYNT